MVKKGLAGKIDWNIYSSSLAKEDNIEEKMLAEVIKRCQDKDIKSQERLYKEYYGYVLGVALSYTSVKDDAIEVVNDSFMKVFKNIQTFKTSKPFKPWLRRITINTAIDKARSNKRLQNHIALNGLEKDSSVNIEAELNAKQIYKLLDELPDLLRFVFNMYEIEGYSHREISEKLEIAESSSRTYLTRAKAELRQNYRNIFLDE